MVLTEGVAVAPDGMVYFSDITFTHFAREKKLPVEAGHIWKFDPSTRKATIFRSPSGMSNGLKFDAAGNLLVAEGADFGGRRVTRTDMTTGKSYILAATFEDRPLNSPNDLTIDEKGRIYFSDPRYSGHEPIDQPIQAVYRIDTDGSLHRIITDVGKPNGVCVSPDQKSLYVVSNDNGTTGIGRLPGQGWERPVHQERRDDAARLRPGRGRHGQVPQGPRRLRAGRWRRWHGLRQGGQSLRCRAPLQAARASMSYSPEGKELDYIPTEVPTNVGFGRGADSKTLYITAGKSLYRIKVNKEGYQLPARTP